MKLQLGSTAPSPAAAVSATQSRTPRTPHGSAPRSSASPRGGSAPVSSSRVMASAGGAGAGVAGTGAGNDSNRDCDSSGAGGSAPPSARQGSSKTLSVQQLRAAVFSDIAPYEKAKPLGAAARHHAASPTKKQLASTKANSIVRDDRGLAPPSIQHPSPSRAEQPSLVGAAARKAKANASPSPNAKANMSKVSSSGALSSGRKTKK